MTRVTYIPLVRHHIQSEHSNVPDDHMLMKTLLALTLAFVGVLAAPALVSADSGKLYPPLPQSPTVTIGQSGNILVRGATVSAVNDTTITATTAWGNHINSWFVQTDGDTKYVNASGDVASRSTFSLGSLISFTGSLVGQGTVDASVVRNWNVPETRPVTFTGTVTATTANSLMFKRGNATTTVLVNSSTTIKDDGATVLLSSINADAVLKVKGTLDTKTNVVTATSIEVKDNDKDDKNDKKEHSYKNGMVKFWNELKARF